MRATGAGQQKARCVESYSVDGVVHALKIDNAADAVFGAAGRLSTPESDITAGQPWYDRGFAVVDLFSPEEFATFRAGLEDSLRGILSDLGRPTQGFTLERYHHFVDEATHAAVVARTRALTAAQLSLDIAGLHDRLGATLGQPLTDSLAQIVPGQSGSMPMILRVNRPRSGDFNPVHKDIYEAVDHLHQVPRLVNFWIPVAGVGPESSLPLAPGSHLLDESVILRTRAGSVVEGRHHRVNSILEWGGARDLHRAVVGEGQVLVFSSHLIHGFAVNDQPDTTRVALEFRLGPALRGR